VTQIATGVLLTMDYLFMGIGLLVMLSGLLIVTLISVRRRQRALDEIFERYVDQ
jgi:hypothetical protein